MTTYTCNYCDRRFDDQTVALNHVATEHSIAMITEITTNVSASRQPSAIAAAWRCPLPRRTDWR